MRQTIQWLAVCAAACNGAGNATRGDGGNGQNANGQDSSGADSSARDAGYPDGGAAGGDDGPAPEGATVEASLPGEGGGSGPRTGTGTTNQGCVTHADCAPGYFCYIGYANPTDTCTQGPSGSCATCQGGSCPNVFDCTCLPASLCPRAMPCTDNGKLIVCPPMRAGP
jgi:hypothetical protein